MSYNEIQDTDFKDKVQFHCPTSLRTELEQHPLFSQLFLTGIGFTPKTMTHKINKEDITNYHTLVFNTDIQTYSPDNSTEHCIESSNFMLIPQGTTCTIGSNHGWSIYWLHFLGTQSKDLFAEFDITYGKPYPISIKQAELTQLFHNIFSMLQTGFSFQNIAYASMTLWHLIGIFLFRNNTLAPIEQSDPIADSIDFMKANLHKELTLEEVASIAGYSPSHFSTLFKERTSTAPITYFISLKMHLASDYLCQTNKTIKEISYLLGYNNQYYFSRLFKTHIGYSPTQYRTVKSNSK